jgi:hypothetical protein
LGDETHFEAMRVDKTPSSAGGLTRPIFEEPPEDMGERAGALIINWVGSRGMSAHELRNIFQIAAERLLDAALARRESWEAVDPILYCYRHAFELALKSILPNRGHDLSMLWQAAYPDLLAKLAPDDVAWLEERVAEFVRTDPALSLIHISEPTRLM